MDAATGLVFVVVFLSVYTLLSRTRQSKTTTNRKLPPCPPFCLPIVGHLPLLAQRDLLETLTLQRQKLGDIYRLQIGRTTVVVISSYRLLYTAFVKNADIFSDRPHTVFLELCKDNGIILLNGPRWKNQRQIVLKNFRHLCARTTILETIIHKQIHRFHDNISSLDGCAVDPKQLLIDVISSVVGEVMIGKIFDTDTVKFKSYVEQHNEVVHLTAKAVILDFLPFLRYLPVDLFNHARVEDLHQKTTSFVKGKIGEKLQQSLGEGEPRDLMEAYLKTSESELDEDQVTQTVSDMFAAGLETTVSTLRWALVYLTQYPDVQSRLQQEVDQALPAGTLPSMADKQAMPYVEAFVMELLRHSDVAPVGLLHTVNCDTYLDGYFIPKGTTIIPNIDSVLKDPDNFESPYEFKPERFIDAEGKVFKPETFIPFFFGKRLCVGEQIARANLMLFLTSLVQAYTVSRHADDTEPVRGALNITYCPSDFKVCFHKRDVTHQGRM
ncbi:cytochrome P450 2E1-like [Mizuhopecten yessoensis]|uniref:cytochrome P450 2E1-like n=1 Tax=Mizuhopecten yessoensis TaxID=6573 RepID=UPI000B45E4A3|nr:cytochrome P450 2E1-like [Mizuhopecten yessoensis]